MKRILIYVICLSGIAAAEEGKLANKMFADRTARKIALRSRSKNSRPCRKMPRTTAARATRETCHLIFREWKRTAAHCGMP